MESFDVKKPFGTAVRSWRNRLGISQEELAARAGLHRTYVCDVERGARNVTLRSIEKLAQALQVSVSTLLAYGRDSGAGSSAGEMVDILMIEDNASDVALAREGLKNVTNRIHVARDGEAALEYLFGSATSDETTVRPRPHLILLDLGLPKVDGIEVLRRIKSDEQAANIPVVILTSSNRERDMQATRRLGAVSYIVKPVDLQNLSRVTPDLNLHWALMKPSAPAVNECR